MKKYYGKEKCKILKQIRAEIAKQNDIDWVVSECKHQGNCRGTCPKCEWEVRKLEEALARREAMGKKVAIVGISAGLSLSVAGCANPFATQGDMEMNPVGNLPGGETVEQTETMVSVGEMMPPETDTAPLVEGGMTEGDATDAPFETAMGAVETNTEEEDDSGDELETDVLMGDPVAWDGEMP